VRFTGNWRASRVPARHQPVAHRPDHLRFARRIEEVPALDDIEIEPAPGLC